MKKTKACIINMNEAILDSRCKNAFELYYGSTGERIEVPNKERFQYLKCDIDFNFPENFHEFNIFAIDLSIKDPVPYNVHDSLHSAQNTKSSKLSFACRYPQTIFEPTPISNYILRGKLDRKISQTLIIIFAESNYEVEYPIIETTSDGSNLLKPEKYSLYNFVQTTANTTPKKGSIVSINDRLNPLLKKFFEEFIHNCNYAQTFYVPKIWDEDGENKIDNPDFLPFMFDVDNEVVSYSHILNNQILIILPQFESNELVLAQFLNNVGPSIIPELFPSVIKNLWTTEPEYFLPNHKALLDKRESIVKMKDLEVSLIDEDIEKNLKSNQFLHSILIDSGDELVENIITFMKWLGFENVVSVDDEKSDLYEEDIQIESDGGLLVIEVKGIGGTSKDNECSQISKIKYRRSKERGAFDVYGLYIVNHQRHLPPLQRNHPPFNSNQIQDAINDERGMITTWNLYLSYYYIQFGLISKKIVRDSLYRFGYIELSELLKMVGCIDETFEDGNIIIVKPTDIEISINDQLTVYYNGMFKNVVVESIQVNGKSTGKVSNVESGLKVSSPIAKKSIIYKA